MMNKKENQEKKNLLIFGYGVSLILFLVGIRLWIKHGLGTGHIIWFGLAGALLVVTIVNYEWLRPLYLRWMKAATGIGVIVSGVILGVLFYGVFGLIGIILRLMGKDLLNQRIEREKATYWAAREPDQRGVERYRQQF